MIERLCAMADLRKPRVAMIDSDVPNAFATGRNQKHAAVAVTTGLWNRLEPKEVEGVLAHELSHIANRDVLVMTVASFFAMIAAVLTRFGLYGGMFGGMGGNRDNNNSVPIWLVVLVVSIVTYFLSQILILAISRYREFAADRGSALITGAPENLMSALQKIASGITQIPQQDLRQVEGMNAFFIIPTNWRKRGRRALHDAPAAREAPGRARRDRPRDGPAGRVARVGLRDVLFGRKQLKDAARRAALRALDRAGHARDRARPEAGRRGGRLLQVALGRRVRAGRERAAGAARRGRASTRARSSRGRRTSSASSGSSCATATSRISSRRCTWSASELEARGFGPQLLAAVFRFEGKGFDGGRVYWIYGYKRGAFWPFVPKGEGKERDNAEELELKAKLEQELPIEPDLTRWFAVFDAPV